MSTVGTPGRAVFGPLSKIAREGCSKRSRVQIGTSRRSTIVEERVRRAPVAYQDLRERDAAVEGEQGSRVRRSRRSADATRSTPRMSCATPACPTRRTAAVREVRQPPRPQLRPRGRRGRRDRSRHRLRPRPEAPLGCDPRRVIEDVDHRNLNSDVPWLEGISRPPRTWPSRSGSGCAQSSRPDRCARSACGRRTRTGPRSVSAPRRCAAAERSATRSPISMS